MSQRQHFLSVLPLFVEPVAAYTLYVLWNTSQTLLERREKAKLAAAEAKLRKMVSELKVITAALQQSCAAAARLTHPARPLRMDCAELLLSLLQIR